MALQAPSRRRCTGEGSRSEPVVVLEPHFIPVTTKDWRRRWLRWPIYSPICLRSRGAIGRKNSRFESWREHGEKSGRTRGGSPTSPPC